MEDDKQEKLQTRREFFRNAAKAVLPIIGAAALSSGIVKAADKIPMGCEHTCSGACRDNCHYACVDTCRGGCGGTCSGKCEGGCKFTCSGSCKNGNNVG